MSDATRAVALTQAVHVVGADGGQAVLDLAAKFDAFLLGSDAPAKVSTPAKEPAKPAARTAAKKTSAKTEDDLARDAASEASTDESEPEAPAEQPYPPTSEGVQAVIAKMLQANKRKEAINLLKKFGAASATGVKAKDAAKFIAEALKVVGVEQAESEDDLTA
mgnify:CR=1 FL=1